MPRRTLETGPVVAAVGAVLLIVSLFLDWFKDGGRGFSGWTAFEVLDLVLAALAVAALLAAGERFGYRTPVVGRSLAAIGLTAVVIVVSQLLNHPPLGLDRSPQVGAWLALGSSLLIAAGGLLGRARISVELVGDRDAETGPDSREVETAARREAAAEEPKVERELYPEPRAPGPIGADDPEQFGGGPEDETRPIP
ncbi:MAG: hypothetical protein ACJ76Z_11675 [Thermoleophilaceae bacterium]